MVAPILSKRRRRILASLYRTYGGVVQRRARQLLGTETEAEEVLQGVFVKLVEHPETLDRIRDPLAWFYVATTRASLNLIRNRKNRERLLEERGPTERPYSLSAEDSAAIGQALSALPDELASVFVYYYVDQMNHAEIAGIVGCSRRQVGYLLERARNQLAGLAIEGGDD